MNNIEGTRHLAEKVMGWAPWSKEREAEIRRKLDGPKRIVVGAERFAELAITDLPDALEVIRELREALKKALTGRDWYYRFHDDIAGSMLDTGTEFGRGKAEGIRVLLLDLNTLFDSLSDALRKAGEEL